MGKVDTLKGSRKGSVGFALTALQRRLASSLEAIFQSLKRRCERLESRLREENLVARGQQFSTQNLETPPEDDDDLSAEEQEELEEKLTDTATAAETIAELEAEIAILARLVEQARGVVRIPVKTMYQEHRRILFERTKFDVSSFQGGRPWLPGRICPPPLGVASLFGISLDGPFSRGNRSRDYVLSNSKCLIIRI